MATQRIKDTDDAWENRELGNDEAFVRAADPSHGAALDEALGLQSISIRLPKQMIDHFKLIAHFHGVGYQPLMRDVMARWLPKALEEVFQAEQTKAQKASEKAVLVKRGPAVEEECVIDEPPRKVA